MLVSVTRLRIRSIRYLPPFVWSNYFVHRQILHTPGFAGGRVLQDANRTYWTLTMWEAEQHMKSFRNSGAHARVMPRLSIWCDEAAYVHWSTSQTGVPTWPEAYTQLVKEGRLSRVLHPSQNHTARHFDEPRLVPLRGLDLHPEASGH